MKLRDKMIKHPNGMWQPKESITISGPNAKAVINPGSQINENTVIAGVPLYKLLDEEIYGNMLKLSGLE